jgi:citrate synthase
MVSAMDTTAIAHGLEGIVVAATRLSEVDGERGRLIIGGYPVEELAPRAGFEEGCFLLWHGRLPREAERVAVRDALAAARVVPAATLTLVRDAAARGAGAMDALRMGVASLLVDEPSAGRAAQERAAIALVGAMPTLVAAYWRARQGRALPVERPELGHAAAFLWLLEGREPVLAAVRALETYCNTVIDHGMNASTFTARVITSTGSDMASAVVGAIGALKGPLHGGAPGPALDLVFAVRAAAAASGRPLAAAAADAVRAVLARGERLMGFGHRVYRVRDPRADVLGAAAPALFAGAGDARLFDDARVVEDATLRVLRAHKPGRRIETNVEFYTALILHGVGLPSALFTPTFALARAGGWTAHVLEQMGDNRLIRPSAAYVGPRDGHWPRRSALSADAGARRH